MYARSSELRALFTDTLNKATQGYIAHTPLRMITSLTLKAKDTQNRLTRPDEGAAHKALLLLMVRLIHADPMLLLNVSLVQRCNIVAIAVLLRQTSSYIETTKSLRRIWTSSNNFNV